MLISTERTDRTSSWSATAATGRFSASSTSIVTSGAVGQQRAAPAPRPERADRRERQERRADRNDRALRREIVGGRAGRRRQHDAVGDEFGEPLLAVDQNAQPRRLIGLAEQRHFVDGAVAVDAAGGVARAHQQRMDDGDLRGGEPFAQSRFGIFVHQKADGAAMHAVDRLAGIHEPLQGREHKPVAAERDDDVGDLRPGVAIAARPAGAAPVAPPARRWRRRRCAYSGERWGVSA